MVSLYSCHVSHQYKKVHECSRYRSIDDTYQSAISHVPTTHNSDDESSVSMLMPSLQLMAFDPLITAVRLVQPISFY